MKHSTQFPDRTMKYFYLRNQRKKQIQRFKEVQLQLATPASFPDCGFFLCPSGT